MGIYREWLLPRITDCACALHAVSDQRRRLVPQACGRVLEIGSGSGLNLPFYDAAHVSEVLALEPSAGMLRLARRRPQPEGLSVSWLQAEAEQLPLREGSIDTVLVTYALCTIPGIAQALAAMKQVLRPGGQLLFSEHGAAPDAGVQRWQRRLEPLWGAMAGGCHLTRDIPALLRAAGFELQVLEAGYLPHTPRVLGYHYRGIALSR